MAVTSAALRKLAALNLSAEQLAGVIDVLADQQEAEEKRLAAQRERKAKSRARSRDNHRTVTGQERDTPSPLIPPDKESPTPKEITPPISPQPLVSRPRSANPMIVLQAVLDPMAAQRWATHCDDKGKRLSPAQAEEQVSILAEVKRLGGSPVDAVKLAINRGWTSLNIEWLQNAGLPMKQPTKAGGDVDWAARLKAYQTDGTWLAWGPKPGEAGCRVPPELLTKVA